MSVNLGFYDFFSYLMPGLLYLYVINEFLRIIGAKSINVSSWLSSGQAPEVTLLVPLLLAAYVITHIFDVLSLRLFFRFLYRLSEKQSATTQSLEMLKDRYPQLPIKFKPKDWEVLFVIIRQRSPESAQNIDRFQANSIMLRNVALGLLFASLLNVVSFFLTMSWTYVFIALVEVLSCWAAISESFKFRTWFFTNVFAASLLYGLSVEEVISNTEKK